MLKKIPNILTIGRILIVPFFVLAFYLPGFYGDLTALILFIVASFTDFLDGMLARFLGEESKLGELLDPIADKLLVIISLIILLISFCSSVQNNYFLRLSFEQNKHRFLNFPHSISPYSFLNVILFQLFQSYRLFL